MFQKQLLPNIFLFHTENDLILRNYTRNFVSQQRFFVKASHNVNEGLDGARESQLSVQCSAISQL